MNAHRAQEHRVQGRGGGHEGEIISEIRHDTVTLVHEATRGTRFSGLITVSFETFYGKTFSIIFYYFIETLSSLFCKKQLQNWVVYVLH